MAELVPLIQSVRLRADDSIISLVSLTLSLLFEVFAGIQEPCLFPAMRVRRMPKGSNIYNAGGGGNYLVRKLKRKRYSLGCTVPLYKGSRNRATVGNVAAID